MTLRTSTRARVLGAAAVAVLVTLVSGCDWIGPGADASRSGYNPNVTGLTATNVASLTETFRTELDGGAGAPAVTADGVFVYSNDTTKSLDRRTGAIRWSTPVPEPDFVFPGENVLVDPANRRVLQVAVTTSAANPAFTRWLDTRTGAVVEEFLDRVDVTARRGSRLAGVSHSHTGLGGYIFTSMSGTDISILLSISTGTPGLQGPTLPTLGDDVVYFGYGNEVQAFDVPTDCPIDWNFPWAYANTCPARWHAAVNAFPTEPVLSPDGTTVYVGTPAGTLYALSAADGSVRWSRWLASPITKPPALADGVLYVTTTNGTIRAIDATDGTTQWSGSADATHQLAVAGDVVYAAGSNTLTAFAADGCGAPTCAPLWSGSTGPGTTTGLAVAYDRVYVSTTTAVLGFAATTPA